MQGTGEAIMGWTLLLCAVAFAVAVFRERQQGKK
jgi:hypothetical protein